MKILHLIDSLGLGGAQIVVKGIFEAQAQNKDIFLFALRQNPPEFQVQHPNSLVYASQKRFSFEPIKDLVVFIKKHQISVLHCHLFRSQVFGFILKTFYFPKIKLIFHEHGQILGSETYNKKEDFIFENFLKIAQIKVNLFVAVSEVIKKNLVQKSNIPTNKIQLVYNFIDEKKFSPKNIQINKIEQRKKIGFLPSDFVVGFIGRLVVGKGWRDLLTALEYMPQNIKLLIAGDGIDRSLLLEWIEKKHWQNRICYIGYTSDSVNQFYALIDLLAVPSYKEAMGLVELEAFALNIPVIAANIEGLNEIVQDQQNGLLFEVKNAKDLAQKILLLFENKDLTQKLVTQAQQDLEKYTLSSYIPKLNDLYSKLL